MGPTITTITLAAFAVLCAWAILRTIGNERQRRLQDLRISSVSQESTAAPKPNPKPSPAPPLRKAA